MLKVFTVIIGFATLAGTLGVLLAGTALRWGIALSGLVCLAVFVIWHFAERADHLRQLCHPFLAHLMEGLGAEAVPLMVEIARQPQLRDLVVEMLQAVASVEPDPSRRYWAYVALGSIGGRKARRALRRGLSDANEFARSGAGEAMRICESESAGSASRRR